MRTIPELQKEALETSLSKGFETNRPLPEAIALMHSELSEALESYRKGEPLLWYDEHGKPEGVAAEYADVVIRLFQDSEARGIDLNDAVEKKLLYNKTRPFKHGGKRI